MIVRISNPLPYHPAHVPLCYYIVNTLLCQQLFGGDDRDRTCCDRSRKIYSLLPYHYGGISRIVWWTVPGSNRGLKLAKLLCSQLYQRPMFGVPPGTRTPTNGFGDRYAAITLGILRLSSHHRISNVFCSRWQCCGRHRECLKIPLRDFSLTVHDNTVQTR